MSFGSKSVTSPKEDPLVALQRDRSVLDLAKLDEDENRRIKQLRSASRGVRAFRAMRSTGSDSLIGSVTNDAPSTTPAPLPVGPRRYQ